MAYFEAPSDSPNKLKFESLQIKLTFTRTGPTTGRLSWNVPSPTAGCDIDTLSYNGIVLTFDVVPASLSTTPKNTIVYNGDPTASTTLHAGDKIGASLVVAALYNDKVTSEVDITDLPPNTPLYFSGYPVDKQLRYYRGGVHAYSLPYGAEGPNRREALPAWQMVQLGYIDNSSLFDINLFANGEMSTGVKATDPTNFPLSPSLLYSFTIYLDKNDETGQLITIDGADAQTYGDLIDAINVQLKQTNSVPVSAGRPYAGSIYLDDPNLQVYQWNGDEHIAKDTIPFLTDPASIALNEYWYKPSTTLLKQWNGTSWNNIPYITSSVNPSTQLSQNTYWYDGGLVHKWNGVVWCDVTTFAQEANPALPTIPSEGSYWYNTETGILYEWDSTCNQWKSVNAIHDPYDPDLITNGNYWFEPDTNKLYFRASGVWTEYTTGPIAISETTPAVPVLNMAWFNPSTDELKIWSLTGWIDVIVVVYHLDPTDRTTCQLWWNPVTDELFVWTFSSPDGWVQVNSFVQQANDPAETPTLDAGTAWFVPSTEKLYIWDGIDWIEKPVIIKATTPNHPALNDIWYKDDTATWNRWNGSAWVSFTPFKSEFDRNAIVDGQYWINTNLPHTVFVRFLGAWVAVPAQLTPYTPAVGYRYYDTIDQELYEWTIHGWAIAIPPARVMLTTHGDMVFISGVNGSLSHICVVDESLFVAIAPTRINPMEIGRDEIPNQQTYAVEGIGTTTSVVERRAIYQYIRQYLGEPDITVELSNEQLDQCIRKALEEFRLRSSSAYKRAFFFLQIVPGKQIYELSDKNVGFNKITRVMNAYRIQSSFLGNATGQGAYGQAMLQHLYQMGSFDLISYHIMSDYVELMNMMFAANLMFTFDEDTRLLYFHQTFGSHEKVLIDAMIERTEQDIMKDRMTKVWIERYALGKAMLMLSEKRGKYASLPGAGGGVQFNAADLRTAGLELLDRCFSEIDEYIANEIEHVGFGADFTMG